MALINIDFTDVPDVYTPIKPGVLLFTCKSANVEENKDKNGHNLVVDAEIKEGVDTGREVKTWISTKAKTQLKRFALACGVTPGKDGFDAADCIGKDFKGVVRANTYVKDGKTVENSRLEDFLIPGDDPAKIK